MIPTAPDPQPVARYSDEWRRLHPLSPLVRASRVLVPLVILAVGDLSRSRSSHSNTNSTQVYIYLGLLLVSVVLAVVAWVVTRWRIEDGVLRIEGGLIRRTSRRFPADQIQAVDIVSPVVARLFGLSELRIRMAAATGGGSRIAYLSNAEAESVRARLLAAAHGVHESTPAPPEQVLYRVPTGPLMASIVLSRTGLLFVAVVAALAIVAVLAPGSLAAVISGGFTYFVIVVTAFFRRLNSEYELTVAQAPDGFRLRSGLFQTASETIPFDRVQGVRLIEPLLWRPMGWCRVVVDVAGRQRSNRENRTVSGPLRAVLPVGVREQGSWIVQRVFPGVPVAGALPPSRARWKSPLRYRNLSWACDGYYAVTTSGRLQRVTDWVPLGKVQSIRRVEGPVQRRLDLASIHLDTAGRNIHAVARDREAAEAAYLLQTLPPLARTARRPRAR